MSAANPDPADRQLNRQRDESHARTDAAVQHSAVSISNTPASDRMLSSSNGNSGERQRSSDVEWSRVSITRDMLQSENANTTPAASCSSANRTGARAANSRRPERHHQDTGSRNATASAVIPITLCSTPAGADTTRTSVMSAEPTMRSMAATITLLCLTV